jgi:hypothetical protein
MLVDKSQAIQGDRIGIPGRMFQVVVRREVYGVPLIFSFYVIKKWLELACRKYLTLVFRIVIKHIDSPNSVPVHLPDSRPSRLPLVFCPPMPKNFEIALCK